MNRVVLAQLARAGLFRFLVPVALTAALFVLALFDVFLPTLEEQLMARKREMICELSRAVLSTLEDYAQQEAQGLLSREAAQKEAIAFLRHVRYGPEGKDYFWINDMHPHIIMHPYRPDLEGTDVSDFADPKGKRLFSAFVDKVRAEGSGYVDYLWQWKDDSSRIVPKVSYVIGFEAWGWVIGTGIYVEDVRAEIAEITQQLWKLCAAILSVVLLLCAFVVWQGFRGESKRAKAEEELAQHRDHLEEMVVKRTHDLVQTQEALRDSQRRLAASIDFLPDAMFVVDKEGVILTWNRAMEDLTGYQAEEMVGEGNYKYALPFYAKRRPILVDVILHPEENYENLYTIKREKDIAFIEIYTEHFQGGAYLWAKAGPLYNAQGEVVGAIETIRNITNRVLAEQELERYRDQLEGLVENRTAELVRVNEQMRQEIQERQRAEETLRKSESKYRELVENANSIILRLDPEGCIRFVNEYFERFFDYSEAEVLGKNAVTMLIPHETAGEVFFNDMVARIAQHPDRFAAVEMSNLRRDASQAWIAWTIKPIFTPQGALTEILCVGNDVSLRKQAEQELHDSEVRYRGLFEGANDGILLIKEHKIIDCNQRAESLLGLRREAIIGLEAKECTPSLDASFSEEDLASGAHFFDWRHRQSTGQTIEMEVGLSNLDAGGQHYRLAIMRDISERKRSEEALRQSEEKYRTIFSLSPEAIVLLDQQGYVLDLNKVIQDWLEYTAEDFIGSCFLSHPAIPESNQPELRRRFAQHMAGEKTPPYELSFLTRSGEMRWGWIRTTLIHDAESGEDYELVMIADSTEQKQAAEEFQRLSTVITQATECVIITDTQARILYVNPAFEEITGYSAEEILGEDPRLLKSEEHPADFFKNMWDTISQGRVWKGHVINKKKDGSLYHSESTISPIFNDQGKIANYAAIARDVTKEAQLEAQLRQSQKMEAIGTLAGGIAHDLNNMLSPILGYTELAIEDLDPDNPSTPSLKEVLKAANRAADLVQQILTFSRRSEQKQKPLRIQPVLREALRLLRGSLPVTIEIQDHIDDQCGPILADATQIHQVIMNLGANAFHAMRDQQNGILAVGLIEMTVTPERASEYLDLAPGNYARVTVSDTGHGMSKAVSQRIFEPYFTTKNTGEGTGLGLATVHGIIKEHSGAIVVYSELEVGATFKIYFPLCVREELAHSEGLFEQAIPVGTERVMVVDDEKPIVEMMQIGLSRLGYQVETFTESLQARQAFMNHPDHYDVVVSDQTMPQLLGVELAQAIHQRRPELPIILCSGFSEAVTQEKVENSGVREYLMKPVSAMDMGIVIRRLLAQT